MKYFAAIFILVQHTVQDSFVFPNSNLDERLVGGIKRAEQRFDGLLNKELENAAASWTPYRLDSQRYYDQQYSVSLRRQRLRVDGARIVSSSNLRQMVLNLQVQASGLEVDGMMSARAMLPRIYSFTSRTDELRCNGTASLNRTDGGLTLDWLFVECPENTQISTQLSTLRSRGRTASGLVAELEKRLVEEFSSALTWLCSASVKTALLNSRGVLGELATSQPYAQLVKEEEDSSNDVLDYILGLVASRIRTMFNDTIPLPDIVQGSQILRSVRLDTGLSAMHGVAKNLSSIKRDGNARVVNNNTTIDFAGKLKFSLIKIHYDSLSVSVLSVGPRGTLDVAAQDAIVALKLKVDFGESKRIFLEQFRITDIGRIGVSIGGLGGLLDTAISEISQLVATLFKKLITRIVEQKITDYARQTLAKNSIEQILTGNITL